MSRRRDQPQFPIAPVLRELGAENVPEPQSGWAKMRCFQHPDQTPSASVSFYGFNCFSCGLTGDAISLIRKAEQLSYVDAVARCEELAGGADFVVRDKHRSGYSLLD